MTLATGIWYNTKMAISQFRLFKICTCIASVLAVFKRLICRSGRGRKLSGDQITLPTAVDYSSVPKQVEEWSSWDDEAPTSVKIEGGNGTLSTQSCVEQLEPDFFKDMAPNIRTTQKIVIKKREPANFGNMDFADGSITFSSRLAATQDIPFIHQSAELGDLETWQENSNAWEEEDDATWQAEEVLRQQKMAEREKRMAEQQRKKMEKEAQRLMKKEQNKMGVKLS